MHYSSWRSEISNHDPFEELCALAASGEIATDHWQVLKAHLEECASCRGVFADMSEIHATWLPEHPDFLVSRDSESEDRLRKAILNRAAKQGAHLSKAARGSSAATVSRFSIGQIPRTWILATAASIVAAFVSGAALVQRMPLRSNGVNVATRTAPVVPVNQIAPPVLRAETPEVPQKDNAQAALEKTIAEAKAEQARLRRQLDEQERKASELAQKNVRATQLVADLRQQLEAAWTTQAQAESELAKLKSIQATTDAITVAQQQEIQQLNDKLTEQSASVDRERQLLSAGREIRDLIAARNLHIIDIRDTDGQGKTSNAFGRVFYTEGKSLVFYAYDLNARQPESGKYAFYVWGKRDGAPQDIRSLGAMSKDDRTQKRWVLTITDPKVVAEIDSVFVTLEPTGKVGKHPTGKRVLSAFLGSPANHP
jgi:hypothetical protein